MHVKRLIMATAVLLAATLVWSGVTASAFAETRYLKNNIHYQGHSGRGGVMAYRASYANYVDPPGGGHEILPVNSAVDISITRQGFRGRALLIVDKKSGRQVYFEYNERNMGIPMEQYIDLISSTQKTPLDKLSAKDRKGIQEGRAFVGMTKAGVRMALGYPAKHRTPSLDSNEWVYWIDRWRTMVVHFNDKGIVDSIR